MRKSVRLTPSSLIAAYSQGLFPMADDEGVVSWYECDPRAIFPLERFHLPRRLARTIKSGRFEIRYDCSFRAVIENCARPAAGRQSTWISKEIIYAFDELHKLGIAHSVETWLDDELVGGVYGVALGGFFAGESMFHLKRDASKVALVNLVERLRKEGYLLFDIQYIVNDHFRQFGVLEISRLEYRSRLDKALGVEARF